jgi:uncharacterized protein (TIGR04255 family)
MGTPLKNPPVYFTVAQVRFNTLLKLGEFLPTIQESLRKAGFPDFGAHKSVVLQFGSQDGQLAPLPGVQERFSFGDVARTHSFLLDVDKLTLQSTNYEQFERFSEKFLKGLSVLNEVVQLDFTERVGLRYLDRVMPRKSETLEQYLATEVLGMNSRLGGKSLHSYSETLTEVDNIKLLSRVVIQDGGLAFPPDIVPGDMVVAQRFKDYEGRCAILDNDGFVDSREVFSAESVDAHLDAIHKVIGKAFRATVNSYALSVWDQEQ